MLFNESENTGLLPLMTKFFNSFHALSAEPASSNRRLEVIANAQALSSFFDARGAELTEIQTSIDRSIRNDVTRINSLVSEIATLSARITETETYQPAHELRDQRSSLIQRLSEVVEIHELESDGTYQLSLGNNRPLVFAGSAMPLTVATSSTGETIVKSGNDDITSEITGGQLAARVTLRDVDLPGYIDRLDQLAFELAREVNEVHSTGYDLDAGTGANFFSPLTSSAGAARNLQLAAAIAADPRKIAAGDQADGTGNDTAIQIGNLLHAQVFSGGSITEQYRGFIFAIGSDTANADLGTRQHQALLHQLENRRQSASGVSIDEETIKILQFQRAFEASARIVRVVDELLQVTLSIGS
jgi:flagellar hook-associated protein 1 FlgK